MAEGCCSGESCGCGATGIYTDKECPRCGRKLMIYGDLQRIHLRLACPDCGYRGADLSPEELRECID